MDGNRFEAMRSLNQELTFEPRKMPARLYCRTLTQNMERAIAWSEFVYCSQNPEKAGKKQPVKAEWKSKKHQLYHYKIMKLHAAQPVGAIQSLFVVMRNVALYKFFGAQ